MADSPDYGPILADLRRRRDELDQAIATIEALAGHGPDAPATHPHSTIPSRNGAASLGPNQFFGMTAPDAVLAYLNAVKRTRTAARIASDLVAGGWSTTSNSPANTIRTTLVRLKEAGEVVQVKGKEWGLIAWFPGLNKRKRQLVEEKVASPAARNGPRSDYHAFLAERMSTGMTMKDAAAAWREKKVG